MLILLGKPEIEDAFACKRFAPFSRSRPPALIEVVSSQATASTGDGSISLFPRMIRNLNDGADRARRGAAEAPQRVVPLEERGCPDAQRGYRHAIDEFVDWYCSEPRLSFSKTVVVRYRMHLELRRLAGGRAQICRIPWSGGEVHPVRGAEGFFPEESSDGRWIYFEHS